MRTYLDMLKTKCRYLILLLESLQQGLALRSGQVLGQACQAGQVSKARPIVVEGGVGGEGSSRVPALGCQASVHVAVHAC